MPKVILVVDDEAMVRDFIEKVLARHGFQVVLAASAPEALDRMESLPRVDLLLTDIRMPRMTGVSLAREIVERRPTTPVLFMSGSCDEDYRSVTAEPLLAKPFRVTQLLARVEAALNGRSVAIGA
jgi:CheY-like chemotaxis protein